MCEIVLHASVFDVNSHDSFALNILFNFKKTNKTEIGSMVCEHKHLHIFDKYIAPKLRKPDFHQLYAYSIHICLNKYFV